MLCTTQLRGNLKQNEAHSAHAESTNKGVNQNSKYIAQVQQQRYESPTVTLTWLAFKYKVHKLHQRYILKYKLYAEGNIFFLAQDVRRGRIILKNIHSTIICPHAV